MDILVHVAMKAAPACEIRDGIAPSKGSLDCLIVMTLVATQDQGGCLGQITIFRNSMNEDSQKRRQYAFLNNTFINTRLYSFLKTKRVQFFLRGKLCASDFARCASYFEEHLLMRTVHVFQNFYENFKKYKESFN